VAVEVKTREAEDFVAPEECLRWHQLRRINRGLQYYAVDNDVYELPWRIDAVLVVIDQDGAVRRFEHLRNVFPA
jgi:Holliday junction resolvase-like predicted endonuclease